MRNFVLASIAICAVAAFVTWPNADVPAPAPSAVGVAEARMINQLREMAKPPAIVVTDESLRPAPIVVAAVTPQVTATETRLVLPEELNIRSAPSRNGDVVGRARQGEALEISDHRDGWVQVAASDGTVGWANADFLAAAH